MNTKNLPLRYCLEKDDDGHDYLIPIHLQDEFHEWLDFNIDKWNSSLSEDAFNNLIWNGTSFEDYMFSGNVTFENPHVNGRKWNVK